MSRDRVTHRPRSLRAYLRWAQREYALEPPARIHGRAIEDDGDPAMTGETKGYLGFHDRHEPNDWRAVACRLDEDGFYLTPLRCAIERVPNPQRRGFLRALASRTFFSGDVAEEFGVPGWAAGDVTYRSLELLWDLYSDRPIPNVSRKSDAQLDAEADKVA